MNENTDLGEPLSSNNWSQRSITTMESAHAAAVRAREAYGMIPQVAESFESLARVLTQTITARGDVWPEGTIEWAFMLGAMDVHVVARRVPVERYLSAEQTAEIGEQLESLEPIYLWETHS